MASRATVLLGALALVLPAVVRFGTKVSSYAVLGAIALVSGGVVLLNDTEFAAGLMAAVGALPGWLVWLALPVVALMLWGSFELSARIYERQDRLGLAVLQALVLTLVLTLPLLSAITAALGVLTPYAPRGKYLLPLYDPVGAAIGLLALAFVLTVVAPAVIRGLAWLDASATLALLGAPSAELRQRVGELVEARARTVSAADAERAKLERDLHDGAQQRLIALSVLLGQAESRLAGAAPGTATTDDDATFVLVRRARAETAGTIDELRTLTRGLRPPILEARGLDAALSAVASRLPMPVLIDVDLPERPDPALEALLYFAVTELLTNVAKHAEGAAASVEVERSGRTLRATVTDGGPGGADVTGGTGLRGLADRLSGVDGRLFLSSPPGGPTVVTLEVPCV